VLDANPFETIGNSHRVRDVYLSPRLHAAAYFINQDAISGHLDFGPLRPIGLRPELA
jgi:hypothetical protein